MRAERTATGKEDGEEDEESAPQITAEGHCSGAGTFPLDSAGDQTKPTYYLALGDSLSIGEQPIGTAPDGSSHEGYTDQLAETLRVENPGLRLVKLGCGGESTGAVLGVVEPTPSGEGCDPSLFRYPHGTRLADAVSFLRAHRNHMALVTVDIGANDTFCLLVLAGSASRRAGPGFGRTCRESSPRDFRLRCSPRA